MNRRDDTMPAYLKAATRQSTRELIEDLRRIAGELARAGPLRWSEICDHAADELEKLSGG